MPAAHTRDLGKRLKNYFPLARIGSSDKLHYVDDYRYSPGLALCNRPIHQASWILATQDPRNAEICKVCASRDYPTEAEWFDFNTCTDCGNYTFGDAANFIRFPVWEMAYPGYGSSIGVGTARPCVGCFENRLGRQLIPEDFYKAVEADSSQSDRLQSRIRGDRFEAS